jgi:membrane-bound serine protease (ClpP class)
MGTKYKSAIIFIICFIFVSFLLPVSASGLKDKVLAIAVKGVINPASADFIGKSIARANSMNAEALIIELDTPGGLDSSMRTIVQDIMASKVPIVVYVSPGGARAASAGVFIAIASHVASMAPGTNIGAAHPVSIGQKMDKTASEKATNDAAAYIRSLAEKNGRNADWAEKAVRFSVSITEAEALKEKIIDLISKDIDALLRDLDGRKVKTVSGERSLNTANAELIRAEMGIRYKVLNVITDPNVAYMLMLLGFYGLFFELTNPGAVFPGVVGSICLILAFYSFQTLPVNYAGFLLIVLAIVLFVLEVKIISHGVLAVGGVISMVIGSLMLFETSGSFIRLSLWVVLPAVGMTALFFIVVLGLVIKSQKRQPSTGAEGLIGVEGVAVTDITKDSGMVSLHGELWSAYADVDMTKGDKVSVEMVSGLRLKVRKTY